MDDAPDLDAAMALAERLLEPEPRVRDMLVRVDGRGLVDPIKDEASKTIQALMAEVRGLREAAHIGMELDNHHNAAKCPYCTPDAAMVQPPRMEWKQTGEMDFDNGRALFYRSALAGACFFTATHETYFDGRPPLVRLSFHGIADRPSSDRPWPGLPQESWGSMEEAGGEAVRHAARYARFLRARAKEIDGRD